MFPKRRFRRAVKRPVIVHLRQDVSMSGVLWGIYADGVELGAAKFVRIDDYDTPLDGVQLVPWDSILWVQELPGVSGATNP